jgi:hypothetical protein
MTVGTNRGPQRASYPCGAREGEQRIGGPCAALQRKRGQIDPLETSRLEIKRQLNALVSKTSRFRSLCLVIFGARARQER